MSSLGYRYLIALTIIFSPQAQSQDYRVWMGACHSSSISSDRIQEEKGLGGAIGLEIDHDLLPRPLSAEAGLEYEKFSGPLLTERFYRFPLLLDVKAFSDYPISIGLKAGISVDYVAVSESLTGNLRLVYEDLFLSARIGPTVQLNLHPDHKIAIQLQSILEQMNINSSRISLAILYGWSLS